MVASKSGFEVRKSLLGLREIGKLFPDYNTILPGFVPEAYFHLG